jgi:hypothetical protein
MKSLFYAAAVYLTACITPATAGPHQNCQKYYVHPSQVNFYEQGILVAIHDQWIQTDALYHDKNGIYITDFSTTDTFWMCAACGNGNPDEESFCSNKTCCYSR